MPHRVLSTLCLFAPAALTVVATMIAAPAGAQEPRWVIPPGREAAVRELVEPITGAGFAGFDAAGVAIRGDHIVIGLADSSPVVDAAGCGEVRPGASPSWLELRRVGPSSERREPSSADRRRGAVRRGALELGWTLCGASLPSSWDAVEARASAARLVGELDPSRLDEVWTAPLPAGARHDPTALPWAFAIALLVVSLALSRWPALALGAAAVALAALTVAIRAFWHQPIIGALWAALLVAALVTIGVSLRRRGQSELVWLGVASVSAFLSTLWQRPLVANWYVDLHEPAGAATGAFVKAPGGPAFVVRLIDRMVELDAVALFSLNRLIFALGVGLAVVAMRRLCRDEGEPWPRHAWIVWWALLLLDGTLGWLAASDAPHLICWLAWSVALLASVELVEGATGAHQRAWLAWSIVLCSALVGLTRMEQLPLPLVIVLLGLPGARRRGRRVQALAALAVVAGVALAGSVSWLRSPGRHLEPGGLGAEALAALPLRWLTTVDLFPLFGPGLTLVLVAVFVVIGLRRPGRLALLTVFAGFELLKLAGGFGAGRIGGTGAVQRYHLIVIALLLWVFAAAGAEVAGRLWALAARRWPGVVGPRARGVAVGLALVAAAVALPVTRGVIDRPAELRVYQAEFRFLRLALQALPPDAVVATTWLNGFDQGLRGFEDALAHPHAALVFARRDLRWRLLEPGAPLPPEAELFYFGATCQLLPGDGARGRLAAGHREVCERARGRVGRWVARSTVPVRPNRQGTVPATMTLELGRLRRR